MPARPIVHLIHPPPYGEVPFKHLGLCYVAAGLGQAGFDTQVHDLSEHHHRAGNDFYDDLILRLSERAGCMSDLPMVDLIGEVLFPDHRDSPLARTIRGQVSQAVEALSSAKIVGISFNTLTAYFSIALGRALRDCGVRVLMGGPLSGARSVSELILRLGAADMVIAGEGDRSAARAVHALIENRPPRDVAGAIWFDGHAIDSNPVDSKVDLDSLPFPRLEGFILDQFFPIQASRGCARSCSYCSEKGIWAGQGHRRRAPSRILAEMDERVALHPLRDFHFHDDLLNCNRRFMDELLTELTDRDYSWESFFEPYGMDPDLISRMRDAGCRLVKYGIQSFSPAVLRRMKRPTRVREIVDTVVNSYRVGISTHYDMLIGHPGETEADHRTNLRLVEELYELTGDRLHFSLNPFYLAVGSEVEREPEKFGVTIEFIEDDDLAKLPSELSAALVKGPPYPVGYRSDVPCETTMRRMADLAEILRSHGKDYLYLGQTHVPNPAGQSRRMLRAVSALGENDSQTTRDARALGDADLTLPTLVLQENSNARLFPCSGRVRLLVSPTTSFQVKLRAIEALPVGARFRILGGEASLNPDLARILAASTRLVRTPLLETNGLRFAQQAFTQAMVRYGLSHAIVMLLGVHAESADALAGVSGAFDMAMEGARNLVNAGVNVQLGMIASAATWQDVPRLSQLVDEKLPEVNDLRVLVADLKGHDAPDRPDPTMLEVQLAALLEGARHRKQTVIFEDRG